MQNWKMKLSHSEGNYKARTSNRTLTITQKYWIRLLVVKDQSMTSQDWYTIRIMLRWDQAPRK